MITKLIKSVVTVGFAFTLVAQANDQSMKSGSNAGSSQPSQSSQSSSESSQKMNSDTIREAQQKLADQGFDVKADGKMGPNTKQAIRDFQSQNSIPETGRLDQKTLAALGVSSGASGTSGAGSSQQPPSGADNSNAPSDTSGSGSSGSGTSDDMNAPSDNSDKSNQGSPSDSGTSGTGSDTNSGSGSDSSGSY